MNTTVIEPTRQDNSAENLIDVAGFSVSVIPNLLNHQSRILPKPGADPDQISLEKLWHTGLDVVDLMDAHARYKISPVRDRLQLPGLLGYTTEVGRKRGKDIFDINCTTALAFAYPVPHEPGQYYKYNEYIRVRPQKPVHLTETETCKYIQPNSAHSETHSEPYFLGTADIWAKVMSKEFPLFIGEGECKGIALGLAGYAAVAFPGAQMMYAPKKSGKNKLHPSLDPDGPRKGKSIPIIDRDIFLTLDSDFIDNKDVRTGFKNLVKNLAVAGAAIERIKLILMPRPASVFAKVGIDDHLTAKLGPRWGGDEEKIRQARSIVEGFIEEGKTAVLNEYVYPATSCIRGADRFMEKFESPNKYLAVLQAEGGSRHNIWAMYNCDHYMVFPVNLPLNGTSSKVAFKDPVLATIAHETWDDGVRLAAQEGDDEDKDKQGEMASDYPNRVYGLVAPQLPARFNETLIEPFEGVSMDDKCVRILGGLINVTKCLETGVDWSRKPEWLLPPNHRWFGTSQIRVSLTNLDAKPECPVFARTVENMFAGDRVKMECLQKAFGKILLSPMFLDYNQFFAFYGTAGSGKSTVTNILIKLIGEHDVIALRGNFGGRFDTSEIPGKRLILFPENEDGSNHHFTPEMAATIKKITGRDVLVCEKKGQQPITFRADAEILIVGNSPPTIEMDDEAFRRRAVYCRAGHKIENPDHGKSKTIMETTELPGIFLWALEGAAKIIAGEKLATPPDCLEDLDFSCVSMNYEERFVSEVIVEKAGRRVTMSELEEAYRSWLRHNRLAAREPGWGKLAGAIRRKYEGKYESKPGKDDNRKSCRVYSGLAVGELMY